jgi:hypothetical protein
MKRNLCNMGPVFTELLKPNTRVELTFCNRKGKILFKLKGVIVFNYGTYATIEYTDNYNQSQMYAVQAKHIYYGKHRLRILTAEEWAEYDMLRR